jgi:hypothetical protein
MRADRTPVPNQPYDGLERTPAGRQGIEYFRPLRGLPTGRYECCSPFSFSSEWPLSIDARDGFGSESAPTG